MGMDTDIGMDMGVDMHMVMGVVMGMDMGMGMGIGNQWHGGITGIHRHSTYVPTCAMQMGMGLRKRSGIGEGTSSSYACISRCSVGSIHSPADVPLGGGSTSPSSRASVGYLFHSMPDG